MQQILERSYQYASFFLDSGVRPGQLVAFYMRNSPEYIFAWFGLLAIVSSVLLEARWTVYPWSSHRILS